MPAADWMIPFFAAVAEGHSTREAARRAGKTNGWIYVCRRDDPAFAQRLEDARNCARKRTLTQRIRAMLEEIEAIPNPSNLPRQLEGRVTAGLARAEEGLRESAAGWDDARRLFD